MPETADVEQLAEAAILQLLYDQNPTSEDWPVQYRHDDDTRALGEEANENDPSLVRSFPAWIIAKASDSEELSHNSGVWVVTVSINMHINVADIERDTVRLIWDKVLEVLLWDDLAARLSQYPDFHCYGAVRDNPRQKETASESRVKTFKYTCHCMPMNHA